MKKSKRDTLESANFARDTAIAWRNTIFCESNNRDLKTALDQCAKELGCRIWYNDDTAPDILAVGSFIHIVDRRLIGEETWRYYVQCCDGSHDDIPCILVDDISDLCLPKTKFVLQLDLGKKSICRITTTIREMKDRLNRKYPAAIREHSMPTVQKKMTRDDGSVSTKFDWE